MMFDKHNKRKRSKECVTREMIPLRRLEFHLLHLIYMEIQCIITEEVGIMNFENENIEFKVQATDDIYKEVIAFANTDG